MRSSSQLSKTVGTYSPGNWPDVNVQSRHVLPTAPSPTTTHLLRARHANSTAQVSKRAGTQSERREAGGGKEKRSDSRAVAGRWPPAPADSAARGPPRWPMHAEEASGRTGGRECAQSAGPGPGTDDWPCRPWMPAQPRAANRPALIASPFRARSNDFVPSAARAAARRRGCALGCAARRSQRLHGLVPLRPGAAAWI